MLGVLISIALLGDSNEYPQHIFFLRNYYCKSFYFRVVIIIVHYFANLQLSTFSGI